MNNPWIQGVICSLIAALLWETIRRLLRSGYPLGLVLTAIGISTVVFSFGNILEPAVQFLLEGQNHRWPLYVKIRMERPGIFVLGLLISGLCPGVVTGLAVIRGRSIGGRLGLSLLWAPLSLSAVDVVVYVYLAMLQRADPELRGLATWGDFSFSLLSNIFGGVVGGLLIWGALHLFVRRYRTEWLTVSMRQNLVKRSRPRQ